MGAAWRPGGGSLQSPPHVDAWLEACWQTFALSLTQMDPGSSSSLAHMDALTAAGTKTRRAASATSVLAATRPLPTAAAMLLLPTGTVTALLLLLWLLLWLLVLLAVGVAAAQ